jgi:hypothetical protein
MTRGERETVIVANLGDLDDGYFTVETSEAGVLARLKRLAGDRLEVEEHREARTGRVRGWFCRVPAEFWRGSQLRVAKKGQPKGHGFAKRALPSAADGPDGGGPVGWFCRVPAEFDEWGGGR